MKQRSILNQKRELKISPSWMILFILGVILSIGFGHPACLAMTRDSGIPEDLVLAVQYFNRGRYSKALNAFEYVIQKDPNTSEAKEALFYSAECFYALKDWRAAVVRYEAFQKKSIKDKAIARLVPHFPEALVQINDLSRAIQVYESGLNGNQDTPESDQISKRVKELKPRFAEELIREKRYQEARDILIGLLGTIEDEDKRLQLEENLAESLFVLKQWSDVIGIYEKLQKAYPKGPVREKLDFQLMLARFNLKEWQAVIEGADRYLKDYPNNPLRLRTIYLKGWALYRMDSYKEAVDFLFNQPEIIPKLKRDDHCPWVKAEEDLLRKDFSEPIAFFRKVIHETQHESQNSIYWLANIRLAESLWESWKFKEGCRIYQKLRKSQGDRQLKLYALFQEAEAYYHQGWFGQTYQILSSFTEMDQETPYHERMIFLKAQSASHVEKWEEAIDLLRRLITLYPHSEYIEETEWNLAEIYYKHNDYQNAVSTLRKFLHQYPNSQRSGEALYLLGWSHIYLEKSNIAEKVFNRLLQLYPEGDLSAEALFSLGQIQLQRKDFLKANTSFAKVMTIATDMELKRKAKFHTALGYFLMGKYSMARKGFEEILKDENPLKIKDALILLGWAYQAEGKYRDANNAFKKYLETYPIYFYSVVRSPLIWRLAKNSYIVGDYQGTMNWIDLILCEAEHTPYHKAARELNLQCLLDQKDYKRYLEMWAPFLDHNPTGPDHVDRDFEKVQAAIKNDALHDTAKRYMEMTIDFAGSPVEMEVLLSLAGILKNQGLYKTALRTYIHAMDRCQGNDHRMKIHQAMGEILHRERAYGFAYQHFEKVASLAKGPLKARATFFLGVIDRKQGREKMALQRFEALLNGDALTEIPSHEKMELGLFLEDESEYSLAIKIFQRILGMETNQKVMAEAQYWIGECYQKDGELDNALDAYMQIPRRYPDSHIWAITAQFKSAEIYQEMGEWEKALNLYKKVAKQGKGKSYGRFAAKRIAEVKILLKEKNK